MTSNWNKTEDGSGILTVTIEGDEWKKAQNKAFNALKAGFSVKGFRKGQVPDALLKAKISPELLAHTAAENMLQSALDQAVEEYDLALIAAPSVDITEATPEKAVLTYTCQTAPDVILGDYKSVRVEKETVEISEEAVEKNIAALQEKYADWVLREDEEPAENGDMVTIDFAGTIDGVLFDGGSAENQEIVLGQGRMIPGFEEQIIGMKNGDEKDITVTFPEDYPSDEVKGKEAVFHIVMHDVKYKELPEADDALAARLNMEGIETLEHYKTRIRDNMAARAEAQAEDKFTNEVIQKVMDLSSVAIPEVMIQQEIDREIAQERTRIEKQFQISFENYLKAVGSTMDQLKENLRKPAEARVKSSLVLEAVADAENLAVSVEEIAQEYAELASLYSLPEERIRQILPVYNIEYDLKQQKALNFLKEEAAKSE